MKTLTLNTNDAASRFDMDNDQAAKFFDYVEQKALANGYDSVDRVSALSVDDESEQFVSKCFASY